MASDVVWAGRLDLGRCHLELDVEFRCGLPRPTPEGEIYHGYVPPERVRRWLGLPGHFARQVETHLHRQQRPREFAVITLRSKSQFTRQSHRSRNIQIQPKRIRQARSQMRRTLSRSLAPHSLLRVRTDPFVTSMYIVDFHIFVSFAPNVLGLPSRE